MKSVVDLATCRIVTANPSTASKLMVFLCVSVQMLMEPLQVAVSGRYLSAFPPCCVPAMLDSAKDDT